MAALPTDLAGVDRPGSLSVLRYGAWSGCIAATAAAAWFVGLGASASHDLVHTFVASETSLTGPILVLFVAVVFTLERIQPAVPRTALARPHVVDAAYLLVFFASGPLVILFETGFSLALHRHAGFLFLSRLPLGSQLLVSALFLIGIDAGNWLGHRANHRSRALWRFHALHHSQEDMSVLTAFRVHPMTHMAYLFALLPGVLLAATGGPPLWAIVGYGFLVVLSHANLPWTYGPVGRVLVSPAFHRLHHASAPVGGLPVANFGFALSVWDRLAGCAVDPDGTGPQPTGIAGRVVPIEQAGPRRSVAGLMASQLAQPFHPGEAMEFQR